MVTFNRVKNTFPEVGNAPDFFQVVEHFLLTDVVQYDRDGGQETTENGPKDVVAGRGGLDNDSHEIGSIIRNYKG
jgi:hypothetical protein